MPARRPRASGLSGLASARAQGLGVTWSGRVAPNSRVVTAGLSSAKAIARLAGSAPTSRARAASSRPAAHPGRVARLTEQARRAAGRGILVVLAGENAAGQRVGRHDLDAAGRRHAPHAPIVDYLPAHQAFP